MKSRMFKTLRFGVLFLSLTAIGPAAFADSVTVFSTDFNSGAPPEFSGVITTEGVQGYAGLGTCLNVFDGDFLRNTSGTPPLKSTLTLTGLPPHMSISLGFLLAIIDSWDGIACFAGTDTFSVRVDGSLVFSEVFENGCGTQSYVPPPGVELARSQFLGFNPGYLDSAYNMGLDPVFQNIPHTAGTLTVEWFAGGPDFTGGDDESWAIDNVEVILDDNVVPPVANDAVKDFSITSNPNGVWSYGWLSSLGSPLNLYTVTDSTTFSGLSAWLETGMTMYAAPLVGHNDTQTTLCYLSFCVPPGYLQLHPGVNDEVSLVRWTAPTSGRFCVQGAVEGLDRFPGGTGFYEVLNSNTILFSATIDSYQSPVFFHHVLTVSAGYTVDFAVDFGQDGNYFNDSTGIQFKVTKETSIAIDIDIKPGTFPNSINPRSRGVIPVAILTTDTFDATTVDPLSVRFGPSGAIEAHGRGHIEDVDGDGDLDLVLHFRTQDTGIVCGDTSASLTGETFGGQMIEGSDSIRTVGCHSR
jgi:hypothetical protein